MARQVKRKSLFCRLNKFTPFRGNLDFPVQILVDPTFLWVEERIRAGYAKTFSVVPAHIFTHNKVR